jgi:hypothetical protein
MQVRRIWIWHGFLCPRHVLVGNRDPMHHASVALVIRLWFGIHFCAGERRGRKFQRAALHICESSHNCTCGAKLWGGRWWDACECYRGQFPRLSCARLQLRKRQRRPGHFFQFHCAELCGACFNPVKQCDGSNGGSITGVLLLSTN